MIWLHACHDRAMLLPCSCHGLVILLVWPGHGKSIAHGKGIQHNTEQPLKSGHVYRLTLPLIIRETHGLQIV
jgi:hypothetical protein